MEERWIKVKDGGGRRERQDRREDRGKLRRSDRLTAAAAINCNHERKAERGSNGAGCGRMHGVLQRRKRKKAAVEGPPTRLETEKRSGMTG
jgi:hypothetical protein